MPSPSRIFLDHSRRTSGFAFWYYPVIREIFFFCSALYFNFYLDCYLPCDSRTMWRSGQIKHLLSALLVLIFSDFLL